MLQNKLPLIKHGMEALTSKIPQGTNSFYSEHSSLSFTQFIRDYRTRFGLCYITEAELKMTPFSTLCVLKPIVIACVGKTE